MKATVSILNSVTEPVQPESDTEKGCAGVKEGRLFRPFLFGAAKEGQRNGEESGWRGKEGDRNEGGKEGHGYGRKPGRTERRKVRRKDRK